MKKLLLCLERDLASSNEMIEFQMWIIYMGRMCSGQSLVFPRVFLKGKLDPTNIWSFGEFSTFVNMFQTLSQPQLFSKFLVFRILQHICMKRNYLASHLVGQNYIYHITIFGQKYILMMFSLFINSTNKYIYLLAFAFSIRCKNV